MTGPLIDGYIPIPQRGTAPRPPPPAPRPTNTVETKYYYKGRVYLSRSSYDAAVRADQQSTAARVASQRAASAAAARAAGIRRGDALRASLRAEYDATTRANRERAILNAAAAKRAAIEAERARLQQAALVRQRAELARIAAEKQRKMVELARFEKAVNDRRMSQAQRVELEAGRSRAKEQVAQSDRAAAAVRRNVAYSDLRERSSAVLRGSSRLLEGDQGQRSQQIGVQSRTAESRSPDWKPPLLEEDRPGGARQEQDRRGSAMVMLRRGNGLAAAQYLESSNAIAGGRWVDRDVWKELENRIILPATKTAEDFKNNVLIDFDIAWAAGDENAMAQLAAENRVLVDQFLSDWGEERGKPGTLQPILQSMLNVSRRNAALLLSDAGINEGNPLRPASYSRMEDILESELQATPANYALQTRQRKAGLILDESDLSRVLTYESDYIDEQGNRQTLTEYGLDAYIARERARDQKLREEAHKINQNRAELGWRLGAQQTAARKEGLDLASSALGIDADELQRRYQAVSNNSNPAVRELEIERMLNEIWTKISGDNVTPFRGHGRAMASEQAAADRKTMEKVVYSLTGATGEDMEYFKGMYLPDAGKVLGSLADPFNQMANAFGEGRQTRIGPHSRQRDVLPGFWQALTTPIGSPGKLWDMLTTPITPYKERLTGVNTEESRHEWALYQTNIESDDPEIRARAHRRWRLYSETGNVSFIAEVVADPLNVLGLVTKPFQAARLASRMVGTAAGASRVSQIGQVARKAGGYLVPEFKSPFSQIVDPVLGGINPKMAEGVNLRNVMNYYHVRRDLAMSDSAKLLGLPVHSALNFSDAQFLDIQRNMDMIGKTLGDSRSAQKLLQQSSLSSAQLFNVIQNELPRIFARYGITTKSPIELAKVIRQIDDSMKRAESASLAEKQLRADTLAATQGAEDLAHARAMQAAPARDRAVLEAEHELRSAQIASKGVQDALDDLTKRNALVSAEARRNRGVSDDLFNALNDIERQIKELPDNANAMRVRANQDAAKYLNEQIDLWQGQLAEDAFSPVLRKRVEKRLASLQANLDEVNVKIKADLKGLPSRREYIKLTNDRSELQAAGKAAREEQGIFAHMDYSGIVADIKKGVVRTNDTRVSASARGGMANLGDGLHLAIEEAPFRNTVKGVGTPQKLSRVFYRLNARGLNDLVTIGSLTELRRLFKKYGVEFTGHASDIKALAAALKAEGLASGLAVRNTAKWRGPVGARLRKSLQGDQLVVFDAAKSGDWVDELTDMVQDTGSLTKSSELAAARLAKAEASVKTAKALRDQVAEATTVNPYQGVSASGKIMVWDPKKQAWLEHKGTKAPDGEFVDTKKTLTLEIERSFEKISDDLTTVTQKYLHLSREARSLADNLTSGTATPAEIREAMRRIPLALDEMAQFEDKMIMFADESYVVEPGLIRARMQTLSDFLNRPGARAVAPSYSQARWEQLRQDTKYINGKLVNYRAHLAGAANDVDRKYWAGMIARMESAKEGVRWEAKALSGSARQAREAARANIERVRGAIRPQQVAHLSLGDTGRSFGVTQDMNDRLQAIDNVTASNADITPELLERYDVMRSVLDNVEITHVPGQRKIDTVPVSDEVVAARTPMRGTKYSVGSSILGRELEDLVGRGPLTVFDAWEILEGAMRSHVYRAQFGGLHRQLRSQVMKVASDAGLAGNIKGLVRLMRTRHQFNAIIPDDPFAWLNDHDILTADRIAEARKFRAKGTIRLNEVQTGRPEPRGLMRNDYDPMVLGVKQQIAKETGVSMYAYDEIRGALSASLLKSRRAEHLEKLALRDAAAFPSKTYDQHFLAAREQMRDKQVVDTFEEFATRPENVNMPMESTIRLFEERYVFNDLHQGTGIKVSQFQKDVMERTWQVRTGTPYANEYARRQWQQGVTVDVTGAALVPLETLVKIHPDFARHYGDAPVRVVEPGSRLYEIFGFSDEATGGTLIFDNLAYDAQQALKVDDAAIAANRAEVKRANIVDHSNRILGRPGREAPDLLPELGAAERASLMAKAQSNQATFNGKPVELDAEFPPGIYVTRKGLNNGGATLYHEAFHLWWTNPASRIEANLVSEMIEETFDVPDLMAKLGMAHTPGDLVAYGEMAEVVAEMYSMWKIGRGWDELLDEIGKTATSREHGARMAEAIKSLQESFARAHGPDRKFFGVGPKAPPLTNRAKMRDWFVDNGMWDPATGDDIRAGRKVWSVDAERKMYQSKFGFEPEWTNRTVLRAILRDQRAMAAANNDWGYSNDDFDELIEGMDLNAEQLQNSMLWGKNGLKQQRSLVELRDYAIQRYGDLVYADDHFVSLPWLMKADETEYLPWLRRSLSAEGRASFKESLEAAAEKMSPALRAQYYDEFGDLRAMGLDIDPAMLGAEGARGAEVMVNDLMKAIEEAATRRLGRMKKKGAFEDGEWISQELMDFSYDITNQLIENKRWQGLFRGRTLLQQAIHMGGWQRMLISTNPAFPFMNLAESYTYKPAILAVAYNGWVPLSITGSKYADAIKTLDDIWDGDSVARVFGQYDGGDFKWGVRLRNGNLHPMRRLIGTLDDTANLGVRASMIGETSLRLDFARVNYGQSYEALRAGGASHIKADFLAKMHAKSLNKAFFASVGDGAIIQAINQIVPFFSYRFKQMKLAVEMSVRHPWIPLTLGKIQDLIIEINREAWIAEHGSEEGFNEDSAANGRLQFWQEDGTVYTFDLSGVSDWTRAMKDAITLVHHGGTAVDVLTTFFRVPHPLQQGLWALITGGDTPWGKKGDWRESFWAVDVIQWMMGQDYADPRDQRDDLQMLSQMLAFKGMGKITPAQQQSAIYFAIKDRDKRAAQEYLDDHPAILTYWDSLKGFTTKQWDPFAEFRMPFARRMLSDAANDEYDEAMRQLKLLEARLDADVFKHAGEPWSEEYREMKKMKDALIYAFYRENPILQQVWGMMMTPAQFAKLQAGWLVDDQVTGWFIMLEKGPKRADFNSDLLFAMANVKWNEAKEAWLLAHPGVVDRLYTSNNALHQAWKDQQLQWTDIFDFQGRMALRIAQEELKPEAERDQEMLDILWQVKNDSQILLDAEGVAYEYEKLVPGTEEKNALLRAKFRRSFLGGDTKIPLLRSYVTMPGFDRYRYDNASPSEQRTMDADAKYYGEIRELAELIKAHQGEEFSDKTDWWGQLEKRGLLERYLRENPDKQFDYDYAVAIGNIIDVHGNQFWKAMMMPENKWILDNFLKKNPEKVGMYNYMKGLDRIWNTIGDDYTRFYSELEKDPWLHAEYFRRNPEKAGKGANSAYGMAISRIAETATSGKHFYEMLDAEPWVKAEYFRRHPEKAAAAAVNQEYMRWMGSWVESIKKEDWVAAGKVWDNMPQWVHERYFTNNPDSGMRNRDGSSSTAVEYKGKWFKSPESRDRYIKWVENGSGGEEPPADGQRPSGSGFGSPEARKRFIDGQTYYAALGGWIELLKTKEYIKADEYFKALPAWVKEKYWTKHPDQRARMELDEGVLRTMAEYFLANEGNKLRIIKDNPQLLEWLDKHGGDETKHRSLVIAIYNAIPTTEAWLKRTFREKYPEVFSHEAAGKRTLESIARKLAEDPERVPFYEKALKLQTAAYAEQLKHEKTPPSPWTMERTKRLKKRKRRRSAAIFSHVANHREATGSPLAA